MAITDAGAGYSGQPGGGTLRPRQSVEAVWAYLADCLLAVAAQPALAPGSTSERRLTDALFNELQARAGDRPFYFDKEPGEATGRRSADLDVRPRDGQSFAIEGRRFQARERFLAFEAKRLPAPERGREREYLVGEHGGVERFKRGLHAPDLLTVGMIAYLQSHDSGHWHAQLDAWIDALIAAGGSAPAWDDDDRLVAEQGAFAAPLAVFRSAPLRAVDGQRLQMRHLWVRVPLPPASSA